jgi:hypothetical protein
LSDGLGDDEEQPPRRTSPKPVTTTEELRTLDEAAMVRGYRAGLGNAADWTERERGYWHGYLNGMGDGGHAKASAEQAELARACVNGGALKADVLRWWANPGATAPNVGDERTTTTTPTDE